MKSKKGITLVALVITIIVLLILAGVSISLVVGDNGVLTQSQKAAKETDLASAKSALELTLSSITSTFMGDVWSDDVNEKIADNVTVYDLDQELQKNGFYIVSFGGSTNSANNTSSQTYYVKDDKNADNTDGAGTKDKPYKTTIVISEGKVGTGDHTNKKSDTSSSTGKATTYKTELEWTETSVRISGDWEVGHEVGTATTVTAPSAT